MGNQKKSNSFIIHGSILAIASVMVRLIGIAYRVPMTNIIGDRGNGFYGNAYTVYSIMLLLSSYSLPLAVSKLVSVRAATGEWKNVGRILKSALLFALISGGFFALMVMIGASFFTQAFFNDSMSSIALRFMAPTIFIMGFLGVFRGFFQGLQTTIPTAVSQILEQVFNAVVSVGAAALLFSYGEKVDLVKKTTDYKYAWGAAGGTIGTGVGAFIALLFFLALYYAYRKVLHKKMRKDKTQTVESYRSVMKIIIITAVPVILSTAVYNVIDLIDSSLFSYYMVHANQYEQYHAIWGAYNGKYLLLIHVPVAFASAMAVSVVPSISEAYAKRNRKLIIHKVNMTLKIVMYVAIPATIGLMVMANPVIKLLFRHDQSDAFLYLTMGGLAVLFFSLSTVTNAVLQGINRMSVPVRHAGIALAFHIAIFFLMTWVLDMGIYGLIIAYIAFGICMSTLNCFSITRYLGYQQDIMKIYVMPLIAAIIMGIACFLAYTLMKSLIGVATFMTLFACVMVAILVAVIIYFVTSILLKCVNQEELKMMPMGTKLVGIAKKLHIM